MTIYRCQIVLPFITGNASDVNINTLHFVDETNTQQDAYDIVAARVTAFVRDIYDSDSVDKVAYVDWPLAHLKIFDLDETPPRVPFVVENIFTNAGTNLSRFPTEVAMVLSFRAAPQAGVPYQRLYNRIFIGCLPGHAIDAATATDFPVFGSTWVNQTLAAAVTLRDKDDVDTKWAQVSKAGGTLVAREISGGFIDNSPDTQRRRSVKSTLKSTWTPT